MKFLFLLYFMISFSSLAASTAAVIGLLDAEIKATEKRVGEKSLPTLHFRLLNLYSEKSKVTKEMENDHYLKAIEEGKNKNKESYSSNSLIYSKKADETGLKLIKLFPKYLKLGEVYFVLGMNDRDYGKAQKAEFYFNQALNHFAKSSPFIFEVKSALADFYYNEKKYQKAIALYQEILQDKSQVWWTKYAYHYAWCLLKVENYDKALQTLLSVYERSKADSKAINMNRDIISNIGLFYYYAKQLEQSLVFYKKETKDSKEALSYGLKMANLLLKKGHLKEAKDYFLSISDLATNADDKFGVLLGLLTLHHEKREFNDFNRVVQEMENLNPKTEFKEDFIYQLKIAIKDGQEIVSRKKESTELAKHLVHFYEVIARFDPKELMPALFYSGEIYYQVNLTAEARNKYQTCIMSGTAASISFIELCFDSLEAVMNEKEKTAPTIDSQKLYLHYLQLLPQGKLASILWRRLFLVYLAEKKVTALNELIVNYNQHFPQDISFQKDMMTKLLTLVIDLKDSNTLEGLNRQLAKGFLGFDTEFKNKSWDVLGNMKLADIQGKAPSQETLILAQKIYDTNEYNQAIRIKASYNMAVALFHLEKTQEANDWLLKTLKIMSEEDWKKNYKEFPGFILGYFNHQDKASLLSLSHFLVDYYCQKEDSQKSFELMSASVHYLLIDKHFEDSLSFFQKHQACVKDSSQKLTLENEFFRYSLENLSTQKLFELSKLYKEVNLFDYLIKFALAGNEEAYDKLQELKNDPVYKDHAYFKNQITSSEFKRVDKALTMPEISLKDLESDFKEEELMSRLQHLLKKLADDKAMVSNFYKMENAAYSLAVTKKLAQNYQQVISMLGDFKPTIADKDYRGTLMYSLRSMRKNLEKEEKVVSKKISQALVIPQEFFRPWEISVMLGVQVPHRSK